MQARYTSELQEGAFADSQPGVDGRPRKLSEQAYLAVRGAILEGELRFGDSVTRRGLATQLGMSLPPVSEALQRLELEGLVRSTPRVGTRVCTPGDLDIRGHLVVREALEGEAARLFAEKATPAQRKRLQELASRVAGVHARGFGHPGALGRAGGSRGGGSASLRGEGNASATQTAPGAGLSSRWRIQLTGAGPAPVRRVAQPIPRLHRRMHGPARLGRDRPQATHDLEVAGIPTGMGADRQAARRRGTPLAEVRGTGTKAWPKSCGGVIQRWPSGGCVTTFAGG